MSYQNRRKRREKTPTARHVRLYHYLLESPAWTSLTALDRAIYVEIAQRYAGPGTNNGRIPYSIGEACETFKIGRATAYRSLSRLQDRGFIVAEKKGAFSLKIKHATEWRLTEFQSDIDKSLALATKEFMRWRPPEHANIQNAGSVAELSVPPQNSIEFSSGTTVAKRARNKFCSGTEKAVSDDSRVLSWNTTSLPGGVRAERRPPLDVSAPGSPSRRPRFPEIRHLQPYVGEPGIGQIGKYSRYVRPKSKRRLCLRAFNGTVAPIQDWFASRVIPDPQDLQ